LSNFYFGFVKVGIGKVGIGKVGIGKVGIGKVGIGKVGIGKVGFGKVGFGKVGIGKVGIGKVGFGKVGFGKVGFGKVGFMLFHKLHKRFCFAFKHYFICKSFFNLVFHIFYLLLSPIAPQSVLHLKLGDRALKYLLMFARHIYN